MRDACWIFAVAVAWLLGVVWERIATRFWEARANLWYNVAIGHEGEIDRLRYQLNHARVPQPPELPRPMSCMEARRPLQSIRREGALAPFDVDSLNTVQEP